MKHSLWQSVEVLIPCKSYLENGRPKIYDRAFDSYENMIEDFMNCYLFTEKKENPDFWDEEVITYKECVFPCDFNEE